MAHLETIQTGNRVVTHVQGRVYRDQVGQRSGRHQREHSLASRTVGKAKQRRRVCLLSVRDAGWLEQYGVSQPCFGSGCTHSHYTRRQIEQAVKTGALRWVGTSQNVAAWTDPREWKGVRGSMQWVPLGSGMSRLQQRGIDSAMTPLDMPQPDDF
jgi:hypothetical protein